MINENDPAIARAVPWLGSFLVGDPQIDAEHRSIIDLSNHVCDLAAKDGDVRSIRRAARELIATTEAHFATEEALFPTIGYHRQLSHMREHLSVLHNLCALLLARTPSDLALAAATGRRLLVEHLIRHDLDFKTWVDRAAGR